LSRLFSPLLIPQYDLPDPPQYHLPELQGRQNSEDIFSEPISSLSPRRWLSCSLRSPEVCIVPKGESKGELDTGAEGTKDNLTSQERKTLASTVYPAKKPHDI
jgi:hypothetical protein